MDLGELFFDLIKWLFGLIFKLAKTYPLYTFCLIGAVVVYKWLKAWTNSEGQVEFKEGKSESRLNPSDLADNFTKHHKKQGMEVDIKRRKDGFDATTNDPIGNEEHYSVRRSREKK